ncbi:MAG TPA: molybdopterin-binding protein [Streptosporangiaceae bacterium]|nr:molybdopterin-binding protein [Streptosporangiaceae bacterium]
MSVINSAMVPDVAARSGTPWSQARQTVYEAGFAERMDPVSLRLGSADGTTLADDLRAQAALPAFPTASVDGFAVRGAGPWRLTGQILAGQVAGELGSDGTAAAVATGAMVPADAEAIIRTEDAIAVDGLIAGSPRSKREWRSAGEEARPGDVLVSAGTPVTPATLGLAAACGYDSLRVRPRPRAAVVISGDELLVSGPPRGGNIRDALGPQIPGWLARLGADLPASSGICLARDDLDSHLAAITQALDAQADIIVFTGGTMHGPADYLRVALGRLNASYVVDTVQCRPGRPMLLAIVPSADGRRTLLAGLPGNPVPAVIALLTLVGPAICGLTGRPLADLPAIELGAPIPSRAENAHLALVHRDCDGRARPFGRASSSVLRDLARAVGFAVIGPHQPAAEGDQVPLIALPVLPGEMLFAFRSTSESALTT